MKQSRYLLVLASWNWKVIGTEKRIFISICWIYPWTFVQSTPYVPNLHFAFGTMRGITLAEHGSLVTKKKKKFFFEVIALVNYQAKVISVMDTGLLVSLNAMLINGHYNHPPIPCEVFCQLILFFI